MLRRNGPVKVCGVRPEAGSESMTDLWKRYVFSQDWKREGVIDGESGEFTQW